MSEAINFNEVINCYAEDGTPLDKIYGAGDYLLWEAPFAGHKIVQRSGPFLLLWSSGYTEFYEYWYTRNSNGTTTENKYPTSRKAILLGDCICPQMYKKDPNRTGSYILDEDVCTVGTSSSLDNLSITGYSVKKSGTKVQYPAAVWEFVRFNDDDGIYLYTPTFNKIIDKNSTYFINDWILTNRLRKGFDWSPYLTSDVFDNTWTNVELYSGTGNAETWKIKDIYSRHQPSVTIFVPNPEAHRPDRISTWFEYESDKNAPIRYLWMVRPENLSHLAPATAIKIPSFVKTLYVSDDEYSRISRSTNTTKIGNIPSGVLQQDTRNSSNPIWYKYDVLMPYVENGYR